MNWHAIIPLKGHDRKTRLAARLTPTERQALTDRMFAHVASILLATPGVGRVTVLSDRRPPGWHGALQHDEGRGLNAELRALADARDASSLLIVHADLPLLGMADVAALLHAGENGYAIAPDRHRIGTNALALMHAREFVFAFGDGSFARHVAAAQGRAVVVSRIGFGLDVDTVDDLAEIRKEAVLF